MKTQKMTITLLLLATGFFFVWLWSRSINTLSTAALPWDIYDSGLYLSGFMSIAFMSVTIMLSTRPAWLEAPFNGLDQIYRLHKWSAILAVIFAVLHWLIEMGDDLVESLFGRDGQSAEQDFSGFVDAMRDAAEDIGEWVIYLLVAMLILSLWKRFPYRAWRYIHRVMPIFYLLLVFHAVWLAPLNWWQQPVGLLLALLLVGGSVASIISLSGKVGKSRQVQACIKTVSTSAAGITEVVCQLDKKWRGHRAGQFAFVTFDRIEGAHPFTIASSDQANCQVTFQIKALGDYTKNLDHKLKAGQRLTVEGPYGRFNFKQGKRGVEQIWIAAGIGVTPFLAWLEDLQKQPEQSPVAQLHYCTSDSVIDPFVKRLESACVGLNGIQLHIHGSVQGEKLTVDRLLSPSLKSKRDAIEVWFCGPSGWAKQLEENLRETLQGPLYFRKEAFELR
jgi:predicted ferric reductase